MWRARRGVIRATAAISVPAGGGGGAATIWNSADKSANVTLSGGDLTATGTAASYSGVRATNSKSTGKWYFEVNWTAHSGEGVLIGVGTSSASLSNYIGSDAHGIGFFPSAGSVYAGGSDITTGSPGTSLSGVVYGVAVDLDADRIYWAKNNVWISSGDPAAGTGGYTTTLGTVFPMVTVKTGDVLVGRFSTGNSYSPPSGFTLWG